MATRWTSKHTGQKIDDTIDYVCNPNLLDNWYFANPVNQRGQTEHYGYGYFIDRWILSEGKCSISESGMTIFVDNTNTWVSQRIDAPVENQIVTVSALMSDGKLYSASGRVTKTQEVTKVFDDGGYIRCLYDSGIAMHVFNIGRFDASSPLTVIAAKLELGSQQTLAHQDADGNWALNEIPDYGEQLARCQRYALALSKQAGHSVYGSGMINAGQNARIVVPLPATMRTKPTVSVTGDIEIIANGSTYAVTSVSVETLSPSAVCLLVNSASLSTAQAAAPALLRSYGGGKGELFLSADL